MTYLSVVTRQLFAEKQPAGPLRIRRAGCCESRIPGSALRRCSGRRVPGEVFAYCRSAVRPVGLVRWFGSVGFGLVGRGWWRYMTMNGL